MGKMEKALLLILMLSGLPLLGVLLIGQPLVRYTEFPPETRYVQHPPFSWPMFVALALGLLLLAAPVIYRTVTSCLTGHEQDRVIHAFPWWGGLGVVLTAISWVLAWNRFPWFVDFQPFTFTPLWLGYILTVNAWTYRRTGHCMMLNRPRYFLWLFPLSAAFWWFFEYLNRFVQNWYYVGPHPFTAWEYFLHATIPFATVLPAVLGTMEFLASYPQIGAGWEQLPPLRTPPKKLAGWAMLFLACVGLVGIAVRPNVLFPLVWVAPLGLITSLQMVGGQETIFSGIGQGDWRSLWLSALAALICGMFWEMWNSRSLSHWEYAIPFVQRFQIFEMPILGYAGYVPFGLECLALAQLFFPESYREM